ncbi:MULTISPECIES: hypothetical protein [unclassified Microcoleus]|uniref:hypothetical protein n=1 Tax=unclassified Microcoleus TaxID=2642155 RepID=UPI002FCF2455
MQITYPQENWNPKLGKPCEKQHSRFPVSDPDGLLDDDDEDIEQYRYRWESNYHHENIDNYTGEAKLDRFEDPEELRCTYKET